ncbi:hypothetical protein GCM10007385_02550 [Tateyamaria omphalii]|uniref:calcium-binding protein n=1 Tax=Tateyamaria omphalii TaxID=299262 RepID=UPI00167BDB60|nr:calcium-binding protein [Tateyamaria omphalii]GGX39096.1 hypothetical protein GCM10007385_02550 [Tateyamaria omphalii]
MPITQAQLDAYLAGNSVDFNLTPDPGPTSTNGIFFQNVFFDTATGDSNSTPQGLATLTALNDISNFNQDDTSFIVRNAIVNVGDDFGTTFGTDSILSISGPSAVLNMTGQPGNSTRFRMASEDGNTTTATAYISDGAQVTIDNADPNAGRGFQVGTNFGAFDDNGLVRPGGQSVSATLVIEGSNTVVSVLNTAGGDRGSLDIGRVFRPDDGVIDTTTNRSAEGRVIVSDGAELNVHQFIGIGTTDGIAGATAEGALVVEGAGTVVNVGNSDGSGENGFMRVAEEGGTGFFILRDGAEFNMFSGTFDAGIQFSGGGDREGGDATGIVTGTGTRLFVENGFIEVGRNIGTASLTISDGAEVETRGMAVAQAGTSDVVVEGTGTRLILASGTEGYLDIGTFGNQSNFIPSTTGTMTIRDGAEVNVRQFVGIGDTQGRDGATATGTLIVEGAGTIVTVGSEDRTGPNGFMRIGDQGGTGSFILRDGATFQLLAGDEFGGGIQMSGSSENENTGGSATALITGAGTHLIAEQDVIFVGRNGGTATMTISDGATVDALFFDAGRGGEGHVIIEGEGTTVNLSGAQVTPEFGAFMTVGRDSEGTVTIRDGADMTITGDGGQFPGFQAGRNDGSNGTVTVTGAGSSITIERGGNTNVDGGETGFIRAGRSSGSEGTINVLNGGVVTNDSEGLLIVAENEGSQGFVNVSGSGSIFDFGATALLSQDAPGMRGNSVVTVSDGGLLRGGEIINNGILDITSGGMVEADLVQDNIIRSSTGVEDVAIDGDLTVRTAGFGLDVLGSGLSLLHDTYSATGHVSLEGSIAILGTSLDALRGLNLELISGSSLSVSGEFTVRFVEFDANGLTQVDAADLLAADATAVSLSFFTSATGLIVDFGFFEQIGNGANETITGSALDDLISGLGGNDSIAGLDGADSLLGGFGADTLDGGVGADTIEGGSGNDSVEGGAGNDSLDGGVGFDTIRGGADNDTINGGDGADSLFGDDGDDRIVGGQGFDQLFGGSGNDTLLSGDTADRVFGGDGNDVIRGGSNVGITVDGLFGEAGDDTIFGDGGFDLLDGGDGNDSLDGGNQADNLFGRGGEDTLIGGQGFDRLFGGAENDVLIGGQGTDGLFGQQGNDDLNGGTESDRLFGGAGNDTLEGGADNDVLFGGAGFDTLFGGLGDDTLEGNFNADLFVFTDGHGADTITDFAATNNFERIDFSGLSTINSLADLNLGSATLGAATQVGGDVLIDTGGGNSILLSGVSLGDLDAFDFVF